MGPCTTAGFGPSCQPARRPTIPPLPACCEAAPGDSFVPRHGPVSSCPLQLDRALSLWSCSHQPCSSPAAAPGKPDSLPETENGAGSGQRARGGGGPAARKEVTPQVGLPRHGTSVAVGSELQQDPGQGWAASRTKGPHPLSPWLDQLFSSIPVKRGTLCPPPAKGRGSTGQAGLRPDGVEYRSRRTALHGAACPSALCPQSCLHRPLPRVPRASVLPGAATTYFSPGLRGGCGRCSVVSAVSSLPPPPPGGAGGGGMADIAH